MNHYPAIIINRLSTARCFIGSKLVPAFLLTLLAWVSASSAWGQPESGCYYYIKSNAGLTYYLRPSTNLYNNNAETPYLKTYQIGDAGSVWRVEKVGEYYHFIHADDGKYILSNLSGTGEQENAVHLEAVSGSPGDNADFIVTANGSNAGSPVYNISPRASSGNSLNPWAGNNHATNNIGIYRNSDGGSKWLFEQVQVPTPVIDYDESTRTITITCSLQGATIYYTVDSSTPTKESTSYDTSFTLSESETKVKAYAVKDGYIDSEMTLLNILQCQPPTITQSGTTISITNNANNPDASIYYTINGTDPTASSATYSGSFTIGTEVRYIKAIAAKENDFSDASEMTTYTVAQLKAPTIKNDNGVITMSAESGTTIRYTTNGADPTTTSAAYNASSKPTYAFGTNIPTIKARAYKDGTFHSEVTTFKPDQVATPSVTNYFDGNVSFSTSTTGDVKYYFTTSTTGSAPADPTTGSSLYGTDDLSLPTGTTITHIKVRAYRLGMNASAATTYVVPQYSAPTFDCENSILTIGAERENSTIYYKFAEEAEWQTYDGSQLDISDKEEVLAYAAHAGYVNSPVARYKEIHSQADITSMSGSYLLASDFSWTTSIGTEDEPFTGSLDGQLKVISASGKPSLVAYANGAIIKNIILKGVSVSGTNVGAICNEARGETRIYNCGVLSGTVTGTGYVGSIVGLLDGNSRVINCFSYADITGGSEVGGIVGYNNYASTQSDLRTMVMNCMFYGDIASGGNISPIYGGEEINNVNGGLPNYNYYRYESPYSKNGLVSKYNRALPMQEKFISRFERYRLLLNSTRPMAAFYATGSVSNANREMAKWVLETADRTNASPMPYPVLKAQGKYPSIINYDAEHAPDSASVGRGQGGRLGNKTLTVTISGVGSNYPSGATITTPSLILNRTDKDFDRFNYNYDKVQLPYYNDVGKGNYTGNRVVTGWKITGMTGGTPGTYNPADEWGGYNFADRNCTDKDLYSVSGRVFSQGAYFDVPNGVKAITIEPYWGQAAYVCDNYYDVNYSNGYSAGNVTVAGKQHDNNTNIDLYGDGNMQKVYTTINNARASMNIPTSGKTVYDYAVVLVGNVHQYATLSDAETPYTIMSVDMNHDNEPDCSFIFSHNNRQKLSPIRFDFLNIVGISDAQMPSGATAFRNVSLFNLRGWFEVTNTCLIHFSEFEYDNSNGDSNSILKSTAPLILLGGTFQQFVSTQKATNLNEKHTQYIHIGSNVWFAKFGNGTHSDGNKFTPHIPISVTGGDYDEFYLSGTFQPNITNMQADNAECYVSGGHFGEMAAGSLEPIQGDVRWDINWADITSFYGGGTNANQTIKGNIQVDIANSHVNLFCGGPKFGDMTDKKTVTTNATGCTFDTFFGAGYGGNSYNRVKYYDVENKSPADYQQNYTDDRGKYFDGKTTNAPGKADYGKKGKGVATDFDYEFFSWANGSTGGRFYVKFISFSLATTHDVSSTLNGCTVTGNFYGGGSLGKVSGNATSTLRNCQVDGSVFGAGYSATRPTIDVRKAPPFIANPSINKNIGFFEMGEINGTEEYHWKQVEPSLLKNNTVGMESTTEGNFVYTDEDLSTLGTVSGNATLNITGDQTLIKGDVYGGGALANANNTTVNLLGGTVWGDVYGGAMGNALTAATVGNVEVNLNKDVSDDARGCVVQGRIFGCNNLNGTPEGTVTVHIYKTQNALATRITNPIPEEGESAPTEKAKGRYDLEAVYGGGNLAAYVPTNALLELNETNQAAVEAACAHVIIDGCDRTSIRQVYGGGNAASVPATRVDIYGTYEIDEVFGGGNGKDDITVDRATRPNPGANVGYRDYSEYYQEGEAWLTRDKADADTKEKRLAAGYAYGSGIANVNIFSGTIHSIFGGSNTKGNIRQKTLVKLDEYEEEGCTYSVDEAYGGGKIATMDGETNLDIQCIPGMGALYGGAENADILGNVTLNITNGRYGQVFGGNNQGGRIAGSITVNIEETGCRPIIIGELYGGGNRAAYSVWGYKQADGQWLPREQSDDEGEGPSVAYTAIADENAASPLVDVKSFTSIGNIYGGGYGETARLVGNPWVKINEITGLQANHDAADIASAGTIVITEKEADRTTTRSVKYPPHEKGAIGTIYNVFGGGNAAEVVGTPHVHIGTESEVTLATGSTPATPIAVEGVDIRGNIYGGGNKAKVKGDTHVQIGKQNLP